MDPRIRSLPPTTFSGRRLTRRQNAAVQETVARCPALSRNELARTVCEHLNWTTPKCGHRVAVGLRMLESLVASGVLALPAKRNTIPEPRLPIVHTGRSDPGSEIACTLAELEPLLLRAATAERDLADWNELVDRHHGLGCPRPFGPHLRWWALDRGGRPGRVDRVAREGPRPPAALGGVEQPVPDLPLGPGRQPCLADTVHGHPSTSWRVGGAPWLPPGPVRDVRGTWRNRCCGARQPSPTPRPGWPSASSRCAAGGGRGGSTQENPCGRSASGPEGDPSRLNPMPTDQTHSQTPCKCVAP